MTNLFLKILGIGQTIWNFIQPLLKSETQSLLSQVLPIALEVVKSIQHTGDLPNVKRDAAYSQLKSATKAAGLDLSTSLLNLAIEVAVTKLKS